MSGICVVGCVIDRCVCCVLVSVLSIRLSICLSVWFAATKQDMCGPTQSHKAPALKTHSSKKLYIYALITDGKEMALM